MTHARKDAINVTGYAVFRKFAGEDQSSTYGVGKAGKGMANRQIEQVPWLYGALGEVPSDVMFICENPSIAGINKAHANTIDG